MQRKINNLWRLANIRNEFALKEHYKNIAQNPDMVFLPPEPYIDLPDGVVVQSTQNYNIDLLGIRHFFENIVTTRKNHSIFHIRLP